MGERRIEGILVLQRERLGLLEVQLDLIFKKTMPPERNIRLPTGLTGLIFIFVRK